MTQGQYRAAASQAKVATIPGEESLSPAYKSGPVPSTPTYVAMGRSRQGLRTPLAASSPSGIPAYQGR